MHDARLHAESTPDARNKPKTCRAVHLGATHTEHAWSTVRSRPRATASCGPVRPLHRMKARAALRTRICGVFLSSKMRPRNVLRQVGQQVNITKMRYGRATCGPQNGRLERAARDVRCRVCCMGMLRALWGGLRGLARAVALYSLYLTFTHAGSPVSRR